jgi:5'-deoxynucleotidase
MEITDLTRLDQPEPRNKVSTQREGYSFYAYLSRMRYISRWGLMRNSCPENVQEHSHMVAVLAHALGLISREVFGKEHVSPETCATVALFHDASEIITGDLPTPVKYYSGEIRDAYKKVEDVAAEELLAMLPTALRGCYEPLLKDVSPEVEKIVKAADKLSAHIKCLEELKASNHEFILAARQTRQALDDMDMPEVQYFIENFLDSFTLTLDELK